MHCVGLCPVSESSGVKCSSSVCQCQHMTHNTNWSGKVEHWKKRRTYSAWNARASEYGCFVWHAHMLRHVLIFCGLQEHTSIADMEWCFRVGAWCDWVKTAQHFPAVGSMRPLSGDMFVWESGTRGCVPPSLLWKSGCRTLVPKRCLRRRCGLRTLFVLRKCRDF